MKAFLWAADTGGCGYYRVTLPGRALSARGHDIGRGTMFQASYDDADTVLGQRVCKVEPSMRWTWMHKTTHMVYDIDDDMWSLDDTNPAHDWYAQPTIRTRMRRCMQIADVVTCATPALAERVTGRVFGDVQVIPNGLPAGILDWPRPPRRRGGKLVLGWAGTPSTLPDLKVATDALRRVANHWHRDVELHTIGVTRAALFETIGSLPGMTVRCTDWINGTAQYLRANDFDVWIAPYRDTPFNRAKVGTKALEAAFLGIPVIATDLPGYRDLIDDGQSGVLIPARGDVTGAWVDAITHLLEDPLARERLGAHARQHVAPQHTIEGYTDLWETALCA